MNWLVSFVVVWINALLIAHVNPWDVNSTIVKDEYTQYNRGKSWDTQWSMAGGDNQKAVPIIHAAKLHGSGGYGASVGNYAHGVVDDPKTGFRKAFTGVTLIPWTVKDTGFRQPPRRGGGGHNNAGPVRPNNFQHRGGNGNFHGQVDNFMGLGNSAQGVGMSGRNDRGYADRPRPHNNNNNNNNAGYGFQVPAPPLAHHNRPDPGFGGQFHGLVRQPGPQQRGGGPGPFQAGGYGAAAAANHRLPTAVFNEYANNARVAAQVWANKVQQRQAFSGKGAGFGTPNSQIGYGKPAPNVGFGRPNPQIGYGQPASNVGFGKPNSQIGYVRQASNVGFGKPNAQIGYGSPNMKAEFVKPNPQVGYGMSNPDLGGYAKQNLNAYVHASQKSFSGAGNQAGYGNTNNNEYGGQNEFKAPANKGAYDSGYGGDNSKASGSNCKEGDKITDPSSKYHFKWCVHGGYIKEPCAPGTKFCANVQTCCQHVQFDDTNAGKTGQYQTQSKSVKGGFGGSGYGSSSGQGYGSNSGVQGYGMNANKGYGSNARQGFGSSSGLGYGSNSGYSSGGRYGAGNKPSYPTLQKSSYAYPNPVSRKSGGYGGAGI